MKTEKVNLLKQHHPAGYTYDLILHDAVLEMADNVKELKDLVYAILWTLIDDNPPPVSFERDMHHRNILREGREALQKEDREHEQKHRRDD